MSFEDIKGQDRALEILREGISRGRIFSSYLFLGPDGVGKKETAKNFAKAVNCLDNKRGQVCDRCTSCNKINSRVHPDVFLVEPKGASFSIAIDQIREVIAKANLKAYEGRKKVFVIDEAHSMNNEASNAFLKTLEEPPRDTIFILISCSKELLLPTIVSRCHIIKFFVASMELVEDIIIEKFSVARSEAKILSRFCGGRIGEAIKMKEKNLIDRKNRIIDSLLNVDSVLACKNGTKKDFSEVLSAYSDKEELKKNLEFIISFFRDIFLYKVMQNEKFLFHIDRIAEIKNLCGRFALEELEHMIKRIIMLCSYIDYNVNPKIVVDVVCNEVRKLSAFGPQQSAA